MKYRVDRGANHEGRSRVVIPSTIACGYCAYCRSGYFSQCDHANPHGAQAGTAFFGGPESSGPFDGLQAEKVRVPFANVGMVRVPDGVSDDQAIMLSDIAPTGYFGAKLAEIKSGDLVAVFGCGPVGQFAIASAKLLGATRVFAVDTVPSRLEMARAQGAEAIDYNEVDPVEAIREVTGGAGADRAIDAVGIDANRPNRGPAAKEAAQRAEEWEKLKKTIAPKTSEAGKNWHPGDAPGQALEWCVKAVAKAGTVSIIGVYPETMRLFPIGEAMGKNLTLQMGNCNHRVLSQVEPLGPVIDAYKAFDQREPGWVKVELVPRRMHA